MRISIFLQIFKIIVFPILIECCRWGFVTEEGASGFGGWCVQQLWFKHYISVRAAIGYQLGCGDEQNL